MGFRVFAALFVSVSLISFSSLGKTTAKIKKLEPTFQSQESLVEKAQKAIAVDPAKQVESASSPQNTGMLIVRGTDLLPKQAPAKFPLGIRFDTLSPLRGTLKSAHNASYRLDDLGSLAITSLQMGFIPGAPKVFDEYRLQVGYQHIPFESQVGNVSESLRLTHYLAFLSAENIFYKRSKWDFRYAFHLGLLQSQITSSENSLLNVTRRTQFVGLGLRSQYKIIESLSADLDVSVNYATNKVEDFEMDPLRLGSGISYVW